MNSTYSLAFYKIYRYRDLNTYILVPTDYVINGRE